METETVTFIAPIFKQIPILGFSLLEQTYKDWELLLMHDGPEGNDCMDILPLDSRINKITMKKNSESRWGHPLRHFGLEFVKERGYNKSKYIVITNGDNYHCPGFCEYFVKALQNNPRAVAAYSETFSHNYQDWKLIPTRLELGYIDPCAVMIRTEVACEVGWRSFQEQSDWLFINDIRKHFSDKRFISVPGMHVVHN